MVAVETSADFAGRYVTTQRFKYQTPTDSGMVRRLTGYSGGFIKNSVIAQEVLTVEFVSVPGNL